MKIKNHEKFIVRLIFLVICIVGFLFMNKTHQKKMNSFKEHDWEQVEATYQTSASYKETDTYRKNGKTKKVKRTRYHWIYEYEVDGKIYTCTDSGNSAKKPLSTSEKRTILVAEDDPFNYLLYESEEAFIKANQSNSKIMLFVLGITFLIVFLMTAGINRRR